MTTPRLGLAELIQNQSQPHVSVNNALRRLDALTQAVAIDFITELPASQADGDTYIVADAGTTGPLVGKENNFIYYSGGWQYIAPFAGLRAYVAYDDATYLFTDSGSPSGWVLESSGGGGGGGGVDSVAGRIGDVVLTAEDLTDLGSANGAASLDGSGKVPTSQLPSSIVGAVSYKGTWNANTNSPDLGASGPSQGFYYVVSTGGTTSLGGITDWKIGDWAIYNGTAWEKVDNSEDVTSVAGRTGAVTLATADIGVAATARILGRKTAGAGAAEELTQSDLLAFLASALAVEYQVALSDMTTAITTGTTKGYMRAPRAFILTAVRASLAVVSSSGTPTVDININGSTILSTKLTIDATEKTSVTAATPAVISGSPLAIVDDNLIEFDIDAAGTGAKGLIVTLIGHV